MTTELVRVTVVASVQADPDQAFATIAPIDLSLIFGRLGPIPGIVGTTGQTGPWDHVGVSRRPQLSDGTEAFEEITAYSPPHHFRYELSGFSNALRLLVLGARGDWEFAPVERGTSIRWTYSFRPLPGRRLLVRLLVAPAWRRYMRRALQAAVREVDRRVAS